MKQSVLHWPDRAQLARLGGIRAQSSSVGNPLAVPPNRYVNPSRGKGACKKTGHKLPENTGRYVANDLPAQNRVEYPPPPTTTRAGV